MVFSDPVLAFVKAFRLKGDVNALKHAAFSTLMFSNAKKLLWELCHQELSSLALPLTSRRSTEKRSQAAADLDDLLAFTKLDEIDEIPEIFCEASQLVLLPPISLDPIGELISGNAASLKSLEDKLSLIQADLNGLSSKVESTKSSVLPPPASYSHAVRSPPNSASGPSFNDGSNMSKNSRSDNLIVFGLPEVKYLPELKQSVDEMLTFIVGKPVPLNDLYRLGRSWSQIF